jgi:hypothetical protein
VGESIILGLWNVVTFFGNFVVKAIFHAGADALFQSVGLVVLGVLVILAVGVFVVRARRR